MCHVVKCISSVERIDTLVRRKAPARRTRSHLWKNRSLRVWCKSGELGWSGQRLVKPTFQHKMYIGRQILPFEIVNGTFVAGAANVSESAQVHDTLKTVWERKWLLIIKTWTLYSF